MSCLLLITIFQQVYSVRVRDKGPDYRGFVHLNASNNTASNNTSTSSMNNNSFQSMVDQMGVDDASFSNPTNSGDHGNNQNNMFGKLVRFYKFVFPI